MNTNRKTKRKEQSAPAPRGGRPAISGPRQRQSEKESALQADWAEEIAFLREQRFTGIDQAIAALVDRVIQRSAHGVSSQEEREFLCDMLSTDEDVCELLREALKLS